METNSLVYIYATNYTLLCILLINTFLVNGNTSLFLMSMLLEIHSLYLKKKTGYFCYSNYVLAIVVKLCFSEIPNKFFYIFV